MSNFTSYRKIHYGIQEVDNQKQGSQSIMAMRLFLLWFPFFFLLTIHLKYKVPSLCFIMVIWCIPMKMRKILTWHFQCWSHQLPLMVSSSVAGFQSEHAYRARTLWWRLLYKMSELMKTNSHLTFVKFMSLKAKTAKALNNTPGPSSKVNTMLVWNVGQQFSASENLSQHIKRHKWMNKTYLKELIGSWNYRIPCKDQKTSNVIKVILHRPWVQAN